MHAVPPVFGKLFSAAGGESALSGTECKTLICPSNAGRTAAADREGGSEVFEPLSALFSARLTAAAWR